MKQRTERPLRQRRQPNVPIQSAMARPISSGESSWTKWIPATVTSVCAGNLRTKSRSRPAERIPPGSAFMSRAPVMDDQRDPLGNIQGFEQGVEVAAVLHETIRLGATVRQLVGVSHADQIGGDAAA